MEDQISRQAGPEGAGFMRILNVSHSLDPVRGGGVTERIFQMSRRLAETGVSCAILTLDIDLTEERRRQLEGVRIITLPCVNKRFYFPRPTFAMVRSVIASVQSSDLVHIMNHWTVINALVYLAAQRLHKPYVVCPAGALPTFGRSAVLKKIYNRLIGYSMVRNAARCIAVTEDEIPHFMAYGAEPQKIVVIPNGINAEDYLEQDDAAFRAGHDLGSYPFILFIGRLNPIKGPDLLLQAFCRLRDRFKNYHLVYAGPDEGMLAGLREFAHAHHMADRVHFIGFIGGAEKSRAYHAASLLVIPSRKEAMSIVVLEAGMAKTPVLITDQCGFPDVTEVNGGLVVPATVEGLEKGLAEMLMGENNLPEMGRHLNRFVTGNYQWRVLIKQYIQLYQQILSTGR